MKGKGTLMILNKLMRLARRMVARVRSTMAHPLPSPPPQGRRGYRFASPVFVFAFGLASSASAAERLRIAFLKTGTLGWEIALMKGRGLDKTADLEIEAIELASTEGGKIALQGGSADIIVSDWLWVARERALGDKLLFAPYSSAPGAVMVAADSPIHAIGDLAGRTLGVAGGPVDKSWLMLQAAARQGGLDLAKAARPQYGAAPLIAEKLAQGEFDAALEFWNYCADLELRRFRRAVEIADVEKQLGAAGPVSMTGYVFTEAFAVAHEQALRRYIAAAAQVRAILAAEPEAWAPIKAQLHLKDDAALALYRKRYLEGALKRPVAEEAADARVLFRALAAIGGKDLVGEASDLEPGAFFDAKAGD